MGCRKRPISAEQILAMKRTSAFAVTKDVFGAAPVEPAPLAIPNRRCSAQLPSPNPGRYP